VFSKSDFEPIPYGGELNQGKKCDFEFFAASDQTPGTFHSGKKFRCDGAGASSCEKNNLSGNVR
jgi:hypothetical protein